MLPKNIVIHNTCDIEQVACGTRKLHKYDYTDHIVNW